MPSGTGASTSEAYVTIGSSAGLSAERALTGTANQVIVTDNGANSTAVLSLPQSIDTGASPIFANVHATGVFYADRATADNYGSGFWCRKQGQAGNASGSILNTAELGYNSFYGWDGAAYGRGAYIIGNARKSSQPRPPWGEDCSYTTPTGGGGP